MNKILFTVRWDRTLESDCFISLDAYFSINVSDDEWNLILRTEALRELSIVPNDIIKKESDINRYLFATGLRLRFNPDMYPHICSVILPEGTQMSPDELESFLNNKTRDELQDFLKSAKI